jgi:tripartite-type tricarboxylate transporter receptor subunit TctC
MLTLAFRSMNPMSPPLISAFAGVCGALLACGPAPAQAQPFYQGKQLTIIVGFTSGGTYDATARLIARHLGKHLAGNPGVVVRNMPGSGSLVATLHLHNAAPKDGTTLAVVGGGVVLEPLLGNARAKYDARQFNWIGGRTPDNFICATWGKVPVKTIVDVTKRETVVGATGPGSRTLTYPKALNELIGARFKIVSGYPGGNEITLALERGEVEGYCGWALGSIMNRAPHWLRDGTITPLVQFTLSKPELPGVPVARDLPKSEQGKQAVDFLSADSTLAWPLVAPPDVPAERVKELRTAFLAMMKDPALLADAKKSKLEINPVPGTEIQALVGRLYTTSPDVIGLVKKISSAQ